MTFGGKGFWTAIEKMPQGAINDQVKLAMDNGINFIDTANAYSEGFSETMPGKSLHDLGINRQNVVIATKVRYLGISNHPDWMVTKANGIADKMGWTKFVASQNYYSRTSRDIEREIIPIAESEKISIMPWSPLAGGFLSGKFTRDNEKAGNSRRDEFDFPPVDKEKAYDIIDELNRIGKNYNVSTARVAMAWMLRKKHKLRKERICRIERQIDE